MPRHSLLRRRSRSVPASLSRRRARTCRTPRPDRQRDRGVEPQRVPDSGKRVDDPEPAQAAEPDPPRPDGNSGRGGDQEKRPAANSDVSPDGLVGVAHDCLPAGEHPSEDSRVTEGYRRGYHCHSDQARRDIQGLPGTAGDRSQRTLNPRVRQRRSQRSYRGTPLKTETSQANPGPASHRAARASGSVNRSSSPQSVRYMSVTSVVRRRLLPLMTRDDTMHDGPRGRGIPRSRADFAGGGRCWVRTNVG